MIPPTIPGAGQEIPVQASEPRALTERIKASILRLIAPVIANRPSQRLVAAPQVTMRDSLSLNLLRQVKFDSIDHSASLGSALDASATALESRSGAPPVSVNSSVNSSADNGPAEQAIVQGQYFKADKSRDHITGQPSHSTITTPDGQEFELLGTLNRAEQQAFRQQHHFRTLPTPDPTNLAGRPDGDVKLVLGAGGFGKVRLARNKATNEIVAVKKYASHLLQIREFDRAKMMSATPHLIQTYAQICVNKSSTGDDLKGYQMMELFGEEDGKKILPHLEFAHDVHPAHGQQQCLELSQGLLLSLRDLHGQNIEHVDVKLDNIFIKQHSGGIVAKLGDYGTLQRHNAGASWQGDRTDINMAGTPSYWPPEVMQPGQVSSAFKRDSFSAGLVMLQWSKGEYLAAQQFDPQSPQITTLNVNNQPIPVNRYSGNVDVPKLVHEEIDGNLQEIVRIVPTNIIRFEGINNPQHTTDEHGNIHPNKGETLDEVIALLLDQDSTTRILPADALALPYFTGRVNT